MMCKYLKWANVRRRANICCGQISEDVLTSAVGKYRTCKDLWAIISRRAKTFWQISGDLQRSFGKYQQTCKDRLANISSGAKICWRQISADKQDLLLNIRRHAKICGQISADIQRSFGKYQQPSEDPLWENIRLCARIFGKISVHVQ